MPLDVLILGDLEAAHFEVKGQLYVMGDADLRATAVGFSLPNSMGDRDDLVVGGALNFATGHVSHGNIVHGPNSLIGNSVVEGMPGGSAVNEAADYVDWGSLGSCYEEQTNHYCGLAPTGITYMNESSITLQAPDDDEVFSSFQVTCEEIDQARVMDFITPTAHQSVLINVVGTGGSCELDITVNYASNRLVWNFCDGVDSLVMKGPSSGAVIASHLDVVGRYSTHTGQVITGNFEGSLDSSRSIFDGCLPAFRE